LAGYGVRFNKMGHGVFANSRPGRERRGTLKRAHSARNVRQRSHSKAAEFERG
jgi:hypothetical protein